MKYLIKRSYSKSTETLIVHHVYFTEPPSRSDVSGPQLDAKVKRGRFGYRRYGGYLGLYDIAGLFVICFNTNNIYDALFELLCGWRDGQEENTELRMRLAGILRKMRLYALAYKLEQGIFYTLQKLGC